MKNLFILTLLGIFLGNGSLSAQTFDDVYDSGSHSRKQKEYTAESVPQEDNHQYSDNDVSQSSQQRQYNNNNQYNDNDVIDYDDDDYYYASRIHRFHHGYWRFGYYSCFFQDPFWWDMSYSYPVFYMNYGYPYGCGGWNHWGWNNWGWNAGWSPYGSCWNSCGWNTGWSPWGGYGYGAFGYGGYGGYYNGYYNGYNNGYYNGYWDGFYNAGYGGYRSGYVYGPRRSVNSSVRLPRNGIRQPETPGTFNNNPRQNSRNTEVTPSSPRIQSLDMPTRNSNQQQPTSPQQPINPNPRQSPQSMPNRDSRDMPSRDNPTDIPSRNDGPTDRNQRNDETTPTDRRSRREERMYQYQQEGQERNQRYNNQNDYRRNNNNESAPSNRQDNRGRMNEQGQQQSRNSFFHIERSRPSNEERNQNRSDNYRSTPRFEAPSREPRMESPRGNSSPSTGMPSRRR